MIEGEINCTVPIDDYEALQLAEQLVAAHKPELSKPEQYALTLTIAYPIKVIENNLARNAQLTQAADEAIRGEDG